jgi:hypothetical protein
MCYDAIVKTVFVADSMTASTASTLLDTVNLVSQKVAPNRVGETLLHSVQEYRHLNLFQKSYNAKKHACVRITDDFFKEQFVS